MERCIIPNPGGELSIEDIIGRDELVVRLWEVLKRQSLVLSAERRIGKTMVLKKMREEAKGSPVRILLYNDLESVHTAADFARTVYNSALTYLDAVTRLKNVTHQVLENINKIKLGLEIGLDVPKQPWQSALVTVMAQLHTYLEKTPGATMIVFLWDEFPIMLDNIANGENPQTAMLVLDTLRSVRYTYPSLRMVYTGSIGMHHILQHLKESKYLNEPLNDMLQEEVGPLDEQSANKLGRGLLTGIGAAERSFPLARIMAVAVDRIPYYMHHLANRLRYEVRPLGEETIAALVSEALVDAQDPWGLRHYDTRINEYYPKADHRLIRTLLDVFALADRPLSFTETANAVRAQQPVEDDHLRALILALRQDHYLQQATDGTYHFRYPLIKRWWRVQRGL